MDSNMKSEQKKNFAFFCLFLRKDYLVTAFRQNEKKGRNKKGGTELLSAYNIPDCPNNKGYIWLLYAS